MTTSNTQIINIVRDRFVFEIVQIKDGTKINALDTNEYHRWSYTTDQTTSMPLPFTPQNIFHMIKEYNSGVSDNIQLILPKTYSEVEPLTMKIICKLKWGNYADGHELSLKLEPYISTLEDRLGWGIYFNCAPDKRVGIRKILTQLTKNYSDSQIKSEKLTEENKNILEDKIKVLVNEKATIEDNYNRQQDDIDNLHNTLEKKETIIINLTDSNKNNEEKIRTLEDTIKKLENMLEPVRNLSEEFKNLFKTQGDKTDCFVKSTNDCATDDCHAVI